MQREKLRGKPQNAARLYRLFNLDRPMCLMMWYGAVKLWMCWGVCAADVWHTFQTARRNKASSDISATQNMVTVCCQLSGTWPVSYGLTDCNICHYLPNCSGNTVQITLVQSKAATQVCCNAVGDHCMCAACFGLYLAHPQAGQHTNHTSVLWHVQHMTFWPVSLTSGFGQLPCSMQSAMHRPAKGLE